MNLPDKVLAYCTENSLLDCDGVIVGLSGGPDSVALLKVLLSLVRSGEYSGRICALHVNHNLRPGDCDKDEAFVKSLCDSEGVLLKCISADVAYEASRTGRTVEEAGRIIRYRAFDGFRAELEQEGGRYFVATAHHGDDLAETFMMNLFRGSGLEGLTGIKARAGSIIRPFLCVTKQEILDYLGDSEYCTDHTNSELDHTRNVWRNVIFPQIAEVSVKAPHQAIRDTSALLAADSEYIASETYKAFDLCKVQAEGDIMLDAFRLRGLHMAIRSRVIRHLFLYAAGTLKDFEYVNLMAAEDVLQSDIPTTASMPWGIVCFMRNGLFGFVRQDRYDHVMTSIVRNMGFIIADGIFEIKIEPASVQKGFTAKIPNSDIQIKARIIENCDELEYNDKSWFCPTDMVSGDIIVRNDLCGMRFAKAGGSGSKQIKRLFTDLKVPAQVRDNVAGVVIGGMVCFIPGAGHGKGFVSSRSRERCGSLCDKVVEIRFEEAGCYGD